MQMQYNPITNKFDMTLDRALIDGSVTDLHKHSKLVASDGDPDPALSVDADGNVELTGKLGIGQSPGSVIDILYDPAITLGPRLINPSGDRWDINISSAGDFFIIGSIGAGGMFRADGITGNIHLGDVSANAETALEITSTEPYTTQHNSTHTNDADERKSRSIAKGEKLDGTEHTLGREEWSHEGSADDEKGQKRTYVNQGSDGDTPTLAHTIDSDLRTTMSKVTVETELVLESSSVTNITAAGGITATKPTMHVQGSGGAVDITANPQIAAGTDGQLLILKGSDDTNSVQLDTGDGLHIHGTAILKEHDIIVFEYDESHTEWDEITRNFHTSEKPWAFKSRDANTGTNYIGGYYKFGAAADDFNPAITHGTANAAYGAHFFLVQAAGASGGTDTVIRITGTTMDDQGNRSAGATVDITVADDGAAGTYYETIEKWIGQIAIVKLSGPDLLCNYGLCKYWDNNNTDFIVTGFEATWLGAANDNTPDIKLRHHKASGWTYNVGAAPTPPSELASMATDYNTEIRIRNDEEGAWKRDNLSTIVSGSTVEGTMIELTTTTNKAYAIGNFMLRIRTN